MSKARTNLALVSTRGEPPVLALRDDDGLMVLACRGIEGAFEQLIRRHQAALRVFCARHCGNGAGDEIAQEVLLTVWHARASYEPRGKFRAYLFTIADRRCKKDARSRVRATRATSAASEYHTQPETPLESLLASERDAALERTLQTLPDEQRQALLLRYAAGLDYDEIADVVARPSATVRSRVFLALARLRKLANTSGAP
jgi:RNA polymerase sigma-70 factor (ECF subfamily)